MKRNSTVITDCGIDEYSTDLPNFPCLIKTIPDLRLKNDLPPFIGA
jgi:hypothetical protein